MEIFATISSIKEGNLFSKIKTLHDNGFNNIELSGIEYLSYSNLNSIINRFQNVKFIFHNYFPIKHNSLMLNLCSLDNDIYKDSIDFYLNIISLCKKLSIRKYSIHAGYFVDFEYSEAGKKKEYKNISNKKKCLQKFIDAWELLLKNAGGELDLYIENNVYSYKDYQNWGQNKPFMLIDLEDFLELKDIIDFKMLLDLGHLNVSCNSLDVSFSDTLDKIIDHTDYLHYSENDSKLDLNNSPKINQKIFNSIKKHNLKNKIITLEINSEVSDLKKTKIMFESLS